jgi:hypothetical protein
MGNQIAPISDQARRTARRVAGLITQADALMITAGAGMSVDSGATPHDGYRILQAWSQAVPHGAFVMTSNVDGQFLAATSDLPRCPSCAALARPNVLMFNDVRWVDAVRREQQQRYEEWLASVREKRLVVIECGAGSAAASIRRVSDRLLERSRVTLVRINPVATEADEPTHVLRLPALQAIGLIHESLPGLFGGADAAAVRSGPPVIDPITDPIQLRMEPVTCVDLGRGLVTPFDGRGISHDDASPFMDRYAEAQTRWVRMPAILGRSAPGFTMTARIFRSPEYDAGGTPGIAIVFVQGPDERAVMTYGIARRAAEGPFLWRLIHETANLPLAALDCPRVPWVARRPDVGTAQHAAALPYLAEFERVLVWTYLRFLVFVDATRKN